MAIYFIGDIQGCYSELKAVLKAAKFNPKHDQLWVAGDMIARGPKSYATIRYLMSLGDSVKAVLGNHDLHFLATAAGLKKPKVNDRLGKLFKAPELPDIIQWLSEQPLIRKLPGQDVYMSHAGISPQWKLKNVLEYSEFASKKLRGNNREKWLKVMYGNGPADWSRVTTKEEKFRYIINACTRMRYCFDDGTLEFACKLSPNQAPQNIKPWFELAQKQLTNCHWIFGHWAALMGESSSSKAIALDTGCVWGGHLTLLRWDDKQWFIEQAH